MRLRTASRALFVALLLASGQAQAQTDALPSWNDGSAKKAIVEFVQATTTQGSPRFVPPAERVATFDQDGTLWVEQPMYTQVIYCLGRVPAVVAKKPELKNVEPFKTVLSDDREVIAKLSTPDHMKILAATLTGMTVDEFKAEGIHLMIGRRPRATIGDSPGDKHLLEYTQAGDGALAQLAPPRATRPTSRSFANLILVLLVGCKDVYGSNVKTRFQSFFTLMTAQPFFFASSIRAWGNVPTSLSGNPEAGP